MIIDQCRKLALRAPPGGVPGCAGRPRVEGGALSAAAGPAHPILVASPFALRQFALGERLPLTGVQVIDPHSNRRCARRLPPPAARAGDKAPADAVDKLADPLMFAAAMVSAGQAEVCIAGNLVNRQRAARWSAPYRPAAGV